jgi:hypothetical protein
MIEKAKAGKNLFMDNFSVKLIFFLFLNKVSAVDGLLANNRSTGIKYYFKKFFINEESSAFFS